MKKLLDLRFVIGVFFLIVGILLFVYHFTGTKDASMSMSVNLWCGIVFIAFGTGMIVLSNTNKIADESQNSNQTE